MLYLEQNSFFAAFDNLFRSCIVHNNFSLFRANCSRFHHPEFIYFIEKLFRCLYFVSAESSLHSSSVILNFLKSKLLYTRSEFSRFLLITVLLSPWTFINSWYCFFAMSVCFFNSMPTGEYPNLLIVGAFFKFFFQVQYLQLSKIHTYQLNCIELCFSRFCYWLFWFSHQQSFFFLNLNGLSDGKFLLFTYNENGSLV